MRRPSLFLALLAAAALPAAAQPGSPARAHEPVVLEGRRFPALLGAPVDRVVGFRYGGGRWTPIPVQVDERDTVNVALAYRHGDFHPPEGCPAPCQQLFTGVDPIPYWTDGGTWLGADSTDLAFDADDEFAFMARDGGPRRPAAAPDPAGTVAGSRVEVRLTAPEGGAPRYVYLFVARRGGLEPGAYVAYDPVFCTPPMQTPSDPCVPFPPSVPYTAHYDVYGTQGGDTLWVGYRLGANPEDTWFRGATYRLHFSDRWILDSLALGPDGPDLIDREKSNGYDFCFRNERVGSAGRGAFVVNRAGPVRAIRAVIGYNSGALVQRHYVLYDRLFEERTYYREHPREDVGGHMTYTDYSEAAVGMRYHSNLAPGGVVIDGHPDPYPEGPLAWELVRGGAGTASGTLFSLVETVFEDLLLVQDPPVAVRITGHYEDGAAGASLQCTGDATPLGASGVRYHGDAEGRLPNSDPRPWYVERNRELYRTEFARRVVLDLANLTDAEVRRLQDRLTRPLVVDVDPDGRLEAAAVRPTAEAPAATRLLPPRPNPAAGPAAVAFELAAGGTVRLTLYDVLGREVAVLHVGPLPPGLHRTPLATAALPAGRYLLRLTTPEGAHTQPFTVVGRRP